MSKIAIVGCDASGKTVFVSALTDYYKSGQRIGQSCALIPANTVTRQYTDKLHHTMRVLHQWPSATVTSSAEGLRKMKWTMMKDCAPLTEIEMLDYGGENFRYAFRDDGTTRNAAVVEVLVNYIAEADYIVITVGMDNMIRKLTPEVYRDMEDGDEEYDRDSEAQWITNGLLKLVKPKLGSNPPGVVVALTQADKHRDKLAEYGGAKALFAKCWADIDMMYPNLTVVAVASVDKLTAGGFPADDYRTDGVLSVMKEFSRYAFGDCDEVSNRLAQLSNRLCNMTDVRTPADFEDTLTQYQSAMRELHDKTAIVQDLYKDDFQKNEKFLVRCKLFVEALKEIERRSIESQTSAEYWNEQLRLFPEMSGSIRGVARFYQRKSEQIRAEEQRKEQARLAEIRRREAEAQRAEEERQRKIRIEEEERRRKAAIEAEERERRRRIQEEQEANRRRREEEERRELELQRLKAEEEKARIEREAVERAGKTKAFVVKSLVITVVLALIGAWYTRDLQRQAEERAQREAQERKARAELEASKRAEREAIAKSTAKEQAQRAQAEAETALAQQKQAEAQAKQAEAVAKAQAAEANRKEAEARALQAQAEAEAQAAEARRKEAEAQANAEVARRAAAADEEKRRQAENARIAREAVAKETEQLLEDLRDAASSDDLDTVRTKIASLKRRSLTSYQKSVITVCDEFCDRLERAQNGDSESQAWIALQHAEQKTIIKQDRQKATQWYVKSAESGNAKAMMKLASWAEDGIGGPKDEKRAVYWYTKAAQANHGNAMYRLGVFHAQGKMGIAKSRATAHDLFVKAKANGCTFTAPKTGVDAWIDATKGDAASRGKSFWGGSKGGDDLDDLLKELESESGGRR